VFVIMLLNAGEEERTNVSRMARYVGLPLGFLLMLRLAWWVGRATASMAPAAGVSPAQTRNLSTLLFRNFALPFELTSILILVAILGAVVLAKRES
jgi:NADH-quinone oxidoreductase subunit J